MPDTDKPKVIPPKPEPKGSIPRLGDGDILVLLVGINKYANISNLGGCIDDLDKIEGFLRRQYTEDGDPGLASNITGINADGKAVKKTTYNIPEEGYGKLIICRLEDAQATYQGIIDTFRGFFKDAGAVDRIWFHFSGHGTESPTAIEFQHLENNKDQGLMCYDTINTDVKYDNILADKELAVLLHEVSVGQSGTPHIIVTIDSCHSGGLTRDTDGPTYRNEEVSDTAEARTIDTYLGFGTHYFKKDAGSSLVPTSTHIVMTACNHLQLAGETSEEGGYFTASLIEALTSQKGFINYTDLLIRTRNAVRRLAKKHPQTPQFEVVGNLSAYTRFLEGTPQGSPERYEILHENGTWAVGVGAIHSLSTTATTQGTASAGQAPIGVHIFDFDHPNVVVAKAVIKGVGPRYSPIEISEGLLETVKEEVLNEILAKNLKLPEEANMEDGATSVTEADLVSQATQRVLNKISKDKKQEIITEILNKLNKERLDGMLTQILGKVTESSLQKFLAKGRTSKNNLFKMVDASLAESVNTILPQINRQIQTDINQSILGGIGQGDLITKKDYFGILTSFPAEPEYVLVEADTVNDITNFIDNASTSFAIKNIYFLSEAVPEIPHSLIVRITEDRIFLEDLGRDAPLEWSRKRSRVHEVLDALSKIVKWRRFVSLNNPTSALLDNITFTVEAFGGPNDEVEFIPLADLDLLENESLSPTTTNNTTQKSDIGKDIQIIATRENRLFEEGESAEKVFGWFPKVEFHNQDDEAPSLFTYLFMLDANYMILGVKEVEKEISTSLIEFDKKTWGLGAEEVESTLYFKLLVSSDPLDVHQLTQDGIDAFRSVVVKDFDPSSTGFKDWCAINIKVRLINEDEMMIG